MGTKLERGYVVEGRYRLETLLGEGGYGAVWKAIQLNVNRPVAIKFLKAMASDPSGMRRFEREAKALGRLQHPNCVTMLDYGQSEAGAFLVTEFLDGERLDHWAEDEHDLAVIFAVAFQVLAALDHAHQQRIVHRDLKPANIVVMTNSAGELVAKVLDFGIASVVGAKRGDITKTGEVFGTPGYMAPEQLLGENNVGPSADLYSFGVVLYQMIERRKLFTANSGIEVALKHLSHDPPLIERPIPDGLQDIVSRLLAKQAKDRFQSAEDVARAMQRVGSAEIVIPPPNAAPHLTGFDAPGPIPQAGAPTPPTRMDKPDGAYGNPTGYGPMGYSSASSSGVRVRPPAPTVRPESNTNLGLIAAGLLLIVGALGVIAYTVWPDEDAPKPNVETANSRATNLLRREHVQVEPLPTRVKVEAHEPDAGPEPAAPPATTAGCGGKAFSPGFQTASIMVGPLETREVHVYVPEGYDPNTPHRTLLAIHDTGQEARVMFDEFDFGPTADRDGVVIVFPEITHIFNPWKGPADWDDAIADLQTAGSVLCLKNTDIMLFGFGSGGHAVQKLACMLPNVGAIAQSTYRNLKKDSYCEHPELPYLYLAPMKDGRDPPGGGPGCMGGDDVVSVDKQEEIYREMYQCEGPARVESRHRGGVCHTWDCKTPYISCRLDGGRPLPRQKDFRLADCEGPRAQFPYRDKVWDFLIESTSSDEADEGK